jgi:hypothetical protein
MGLAIIRSASRLASPKKNVIFPLTVAKRLLQASSMMKRASGRVSPSPLSRAPPFLSSRCRDEMSPSPSYVRPSGWGEI